VDRAFGFALLIALFKTKGRPVLSRFPPVTVMVWGRRLTLVFGVAPRFVSDEDPVLRFELNHPSEARPTLFEV